MNTLHNLAQQPLSCMGIIKLTISIHPSLVIITIIFFGLIYAQSKQKERGFFNQIKYFHYMTNMVMP